MGKSIDLSLHCWRCWKLLPESATSQNCVPPCGARTGHGDERPDYLKYPNRGVNQNKPERVRRGQSGDKLRRRAFEGKI